jgi:hypothetical protein
MYWSAALLVMALATMCIMLITSGDQLRQEAKKKTNRELIQADGRSSRPNTNALRTITEWR